MQRISAATSDVRNPVPGHLKDQVERAILPNPSEHLAVAVSGGGDSMALLHLLQHCGVAHNFQISALSVDHGLRPEAGAEIDMVRAYCQDLGIAHQTLSWRGWDGTGNLQAEARKARYSLMGAWARENNIDTVALGHTIDDQAETIVMRLARDAGIDGLTGISARSLRDGITWIRPLLQATRADLRRYLSEFNVPWVDDPSNDDAHFERVRVRQTLAQLAPLGIDPAGLSRVASHMAEAKKALNWQTFLAAKDISEVKAGAVKINSKALLALPDEIQRRFFSRVLNWINCGGYPARRGGVASMMAAVNARVASTVDGCHALPVKDHVWIFREWNAVKDVACHLDAHWDNRWSVWCEDQSIHTDGFELRGLGEPGLLNCPNWRQSGLPRRVLLSTPAIWKGDQLVAAPLAGPCDKWHADIKNDSETFFAALLMH